MLLGARCTEKADIYSYGGCAARLAGSGWLVGPPSEGGPCCAKRLAQHAAEHARLPAWPRRASCLISTPCGAPLRCRRGAVGDLHLHDAHPGATEGCRVRAVAGRGGRWDVQGHGIPSLGLNGSQGCC